MKIQTKTLTLVLAVLVVAVLAMSLASVSAYELLCLSKGQTVKFSQCNAAIKDRTCDAGFCPYCVSLTNTSAFCPASINACNGLGLSCTFLNDTTVDQKAPNITVITPVQGAVYSKSSSIFLALDFSEEVDVRILDLINGQGRFSQLCSNCLAYNRTRTFKEGLNQYLITATDGAGNTGSANFSFFLDTIKPKVIKINPNMGFTNGSIRIDIQEQNPKSLTLYFNDSSPNATLTNVVPVSLANCINTNGKDKYSCNVNLNLASYSNKTIYVWANITDISDKIGTIKPAKLIVDVIPPQITLKSNLTLNKLNLNFTINESNFAGLKYIDYSSSFPRLNTLCASLSKGTCTKILTLPVGNHSFDFVAFDKGGNTVTKHLDVSI